MMRTIAAILALTPAALVAQSSAPAQPSSTPVLQSALLQPAAFAASSASDATSHTVRVSTGVVPPVRLADVNPSLDAGPYELRSGDRTLVISMTIDATGKPTNLKLVRSADDRIVNERILAAVSQFRYQPGTVNGQPVDFPYTVEYTLQQGARY